jgi:uncharacterized membrane protein
MPNTDTIKIIYFKLKYLYNHKFIKEVYRKMLWNKKLCKIIGTSLFNFYMYIKYGMSNCVKCIRYFKIKLFSDYKNCLKG